MFKFGETVKGYKVKVLNEREIRAGAGIVFAFALISFTKSWFTGDFSMMKIFIVSFLIDFAIRIFINPKYSPSLILGRIAVSGQKVEYSGANQKRFAWGLGWLLSLIMFFVLVVNNMVGPINLILCLTCLILLFSESVFGICLGCYVYNKFAKDEYQLCPGGSCEMNKKESIQKVSMYALFILIAFLAIIFSLARSNALESIGDRFANVDEKDCVVPDWAISAGHKDLWKMHNGCE